MTRLCLLWAVFLLCLETVAAPLTVLVGQHKPPYIDLEHSNGSDAEISQETIARGVTASGFEIELLREIVKRMGHEAVFVHVPNARIRLQLEAGAGDIATLQPVYPAQPDETDLYFSEPYVRYQNVVVTRLADNLTLTQPSDLAKYSMVAFQGASVVLGQAFSQMVRTASAYRETVDQKAQADALLNGRVDAIVVDRNIFTHHHQHASQPVEVVMHELFHSTLYRAAFRSVRLQQAFNRALLSVLLDHWYQQLQLRYFKQLNQTLPSAALCSGLVTTVPIALQQ